MTSDKTLAIQKCVGGGRSIRNANRKQSENEIETSLSFGKTQMGQTQKHDESGSMLLMKIFSIAMHDGDDHRSVEEGYDKAGDQNKYDNNKNEERAKN